VVEKLSQHRRIVGLKDSEQDKARHDEAIDRWADRDDFSHLIGWATISADGLLLGSDGLVPSTGNLFPQLYVNLYNAARENDVETARRLQNETDEISRVYQKDFLICDSLAALKVMMHEAGLCQPHVLPPLQRINSEREVAIRKKTVELLQKYNAKLSGI
jgi:4-hydroxy-tetrahydrodipicolinate synthase